MKILSIVIPCYNEKNTVKPLLNKILALKIAGWQTEVVVVDDGSKDGTRDILKDYETKLTVIYHTQNGGKGTAVKTGLAKTTGDYILIQDADLEYEPTEISLLIEALEQNRGQVIYGSRNLHHTKRKGMYIPRLGVWLITKEFNWLYNEKLTDLWTCYKLFPRQAIPLFTAGRFESELIFSARLAKAGYKSAEVPISHQPRKNDAGKKIRYRDGVLGLWVVLREWFK